MNEDVKKWQRVHTVNFLLRVEINKLDKILGKEISGLLIGHTPYQTKLRTRIAECDNVELVCRAHDWTLFTLEIHAANCKAIVDYRAKGPMISGNVYEAYEGVR